MDMSVIFSCRRWKPLRGRKIYRRKHFLS